MTEQTHVSVGPLRIGNDLPFVLIAGPCQIESLDHARRMAEGQAQEKLLAGLAEAFDLDAYVHAAQRLVESGSLYARELVAAPFEPGDPDLFYYAPPLGVAMLPLARLRRFELEFQATPDADPEATVVDLSVTRAHRIDHDKG